METNNDLLKLSEKMGLRGLEDECIVLEDERACSSSPKWTRKMIINYLYF